MVLTFLEIWHHGGQPDFQNIWLEGWDKTARPGWMFSTKWVWPFWIPHIVRNMGVNRISTIYGWKAEQKMQKLGGTKILHFHDFQYYPISCKNGFDLFGNLPSWGLWEPTVFSKYMAGRLRYNGKTRLNGVVPTIIMDDFIDDVFIEKF